jgi:putative nucleotidyltransferase with HDIG domain
MSLQIDRQVDRADDRHQAGPAGAESTDPIARALAVASEMSRFEDPREMLACATGYGRAFLGFDQSILATRRDLSPPNVRLMHGPLVPESIDPWKQTPALPVIGGGVMAALLYEGRVRVIEELVIDPDDPSAIHLAGMRSLVAIPHFHAGRAVDMVYHLRREPARFAPEQVAQITILSNLFAQSVWNAARAREKTEAEADAKNQYQLVTQLANDVMSSAMDLRDDNELLEQRVRVRTAELREAHLDTIYMLAVASEAKDDETGQHVRRIEKLARQLAKALGMTDRQADAIGLAAILHDVGKIHVPDQVLKKPGKLSPQERALMQQHTVVGERILGENPFFETARRIARSHHENFDGSGYPDRARGEAIPIEARIVHLADVYDALTHPRIYKPAWSSAQARAFVQEASGHMFDPELLRAFASVDADN